MGRDAGFVLMAAGVGGLAWALAFVGGAFSSGTLAGLLLAVCLIPFWWALEGARSRSVVLTGASGFVFGTAAYTAGHFWLLRLVDVFLAGRAGPGLFLWSAYGLWFALGFVLYALVHRALRRRGVSRPIAGVAPWLVLEWLWPLLFPVHVGVPLVEITPLAQIADLGGPLLLSLLVLLVNAAVFETGWAFADRKARPGVVWAVALSAVAVSLVYGTIREASLVRVVDAAPRLRVGLVQANLGLLEKRLRGVVSHRRHLEETRRLLEEGAVDLLVWPETAYTRAFRGPLPVSGRLVQQGIDIPLLFGGNLLVGRDLEAAAGSEGGQSNAAFLVGRDGMIRGVYQKNLLIPLAEWNPLADLLPGMNAAFPHAQRFVAADRTPALRLDDWRIAVPICYEAVRPGFVRRMVNEARPNLLITLANDAWFGDSVEPWLHLRSARLRSIEHHLFLVRSTNSGISAIVDPLGRILARTGTQERAHLRAEVRGLSGRTLYGRFGDWSGPLAFLIVLIALRRRSDPPGPGP